MEKVEGIGGFFFRAKDPESLSRWYFDNLGVSLMPKRYDDEPWIQESGPTIFAPFDEESDYFGNPSQKWMVNFRVKNLQAMVQQLQTSGISVTVDKKEYPNGQFARLYDPEGNPIELWQPKSVT